MKLRGFGVLGFWGFGGHQLLGVSGVLVYLRRVLFATYHVDGPASVILRHQVQTFGMVDAVLLPAINQFVLEHRCLLGRDASLSLEVPSDKFRHDHAFWWDTHFLMAGFNIIVSEMIGVMEHNQLSNKLNLGNETSNTLPNFWLFSLLVS